MQDATILTFIKDWVWAPLLGLVAWAWAFLNGRITSVELATKAHADERVSTLGLEVTRQRDVSAKIFDKLEEMQKESADRHERLLMALHEGLEGKADKP